MAYQGGAPETPGGNRWQNGQRLMVPHAYSKKYTAGTAHALKKIMEGKDANSNRTSAREGPTSLLTPAQRIWTTSVNECLLFR